MIFLSWLITILMILAVVLLPYFFRKYVIVSKIEEFFGFPDSDWTNTFPKPFKYFVNWAEGIIALLLLSMILIIGFGLGYLIWVIASGIQELIFSFLKGE